MTTHKVANCLSLTTPMNSCSSSASAKMSYTLQVETRDGKGGGGLAAHQELLHVLRSE